MVLKIKLGTVHKTRYVGFANFNFSEMDKIHERKQLKNGLESNGYRKGYKYQSGWQGRYSGNIVFIIQQKQRQRSVPSSRQCEAVLVTQDHMSYSVRVGHTRLTDGQCAKLGVRRVRRIKVNSLFINMQLAVRKEAECLQRK